MPAVPRADGRLRDGVASRYATERVTREASGHVLPLRRVPHDREPRAVVAGTRVLRDGVADGLVHEPLHGMGGTSATVIVLFEAARSAATMS